MYLVILILFLITAGFLWLDFIGLVNLNKYREQYLPGTKSLSIQSKDDEPSLLQWEELKKTKEKLDELSESLAAKQIKLNERERQIKKLEEQLAQRRKGLDLEAKKLQQEKKQYASYKKNIEDLAQKIGNMPPDGAIKIMANWDDILVIDVLRRMDSLAADEGRQSITSYLLFLIQQQNPERAGNIMRKMAEFVPESS